MSPVRFIRTFGEFIACAAVAVWLAYRWIDSGLDNAFFGLGSLLFLLLTCHFYVVAVHRWDCYRNAERVARRAAMRR